MNLNLESTVSSLHNFIISELHYFLLGPSGKNADSKMIFDQNLWDRKTSGDRPYNLKYSQSLTPFTLGEHLVSIFIFGLGLDPKTFFNSIQIQM